VGDARADAIVRRRRRREKHRLWSNSTAWAAQFSPVARADLRGDNETKYLRRVMPGTLIAISVRPMSPYEGDDR
jgi:hypothetical protein